ncbi:MAG: hypothetical protein J6J17_05400 [Bacilli bacterium]|nr:hypothetical protein [Bacilli bacterium]
MYKSTELNIIDYSCIKTMSKGGAYASFENIALALKNYINYNDSLGITSLDYARDYLKTLTKDDIEKELLKNVVKKFACSNYHNYMRLLGTEKSFNDELNVKEVEFLVFKSISEMHMDGVKYLLEKYPKLIDSLIDSFVSSRYYSESYMIDNLDNDKFITPEYQRLIEKIDSYYQVKKGMDI